MAPEQVRGETQKIDARTDIWALGVSLYHLLTGRSPFEGSQPQQVFEAIKEADPQPPRQLRPEIPVELERITLRCLEKLKADRYTSMRDLERDLRTWRDAPAQQRSSKSLGAANAANASGRNGLPSEARVARGGDGAGDSDASGPDGNWTARESTLLAPGKPKRPGSDAGPNQRSALPNQLAGANASGGSSGGSSSASSGGSLGGSLGGSSGAGAAAVGSSASRGSSIGAESSVPLPAALQVVPKGLRSFDGRDADFFLELLPGVRERNLLPPSINFWKERIETDDPAQSPSVGLVSGPSGCGKSSLMKAGILPRLKASVAAVYLEATPGDTESRLLSALRYRCKSIPAGLGLVEVMEGLANAQWLPPGEKVLIVLDQFEQWLYARRADAAAVLRDALGQCDG